MIQYIKGNHDPESLLLDYGNRGVQNWLGIQPGWKTIDVVLM